MKYKKYQNNFIKGKIVHKRIALKGWKLTAISIRSIIKSMAKGAFLKVYI